jgi:hypothetical membrane protein
MTRTRAQFVQSGEPAAFVAVLATVYFLAAAAAAHVVNTQYDFFRDYMSDYAVGSWGWIYASAYWASFIGWVALAVALWQAAPAAALSRTGVVLLVIVGIASLLLFYFPTDILPPGAPPTTNVGKIHLLAAVASWILFVIAAPMISSRLCRSAYWAPWRRPLLILAWLATPLLAILVVVVAAKAPFGGLAEKAFILDRSLWALLLGLLALKSARKSLADLSAK